MIFLIPAILPNVNASSVGANVPLWILGLSTLMVGLPLSASSD